MKYYELKADGTIGRWTTDKEVAEANGLTLETEREFEIAWNGKTYFAGEAPAKPPRVADYDMALEEHLLSERVARGYTTREPTAYANSKNEIWRQDAADWSAHVDAVMEYALDVENAVKTGGVVPTLEEFKAALPKIVWMFG